MAHSLCALRVECSGCCYCQGPRTSFRRLLVQAISRTHRAKSSSLLPGRPCPLYATIFHAAQVSFIFDGWWSCHPLSVDAFLDLRHGKMNTPLSVRFCQTNSLVLAAALIQDGFNRYHQRRSEVLCASSMALYFLCVPSKMLLWWQQL